MRRRLSHLQGPLVLLVIVIGFCWKLTLTGQFTWMNSPDVANQVLPWYQFQAREWNSGRFPLWSPHEWGGQPLLAQGQPGAAFPLNWLLFALPLRQGVIRNQWLNWHFVLIHYLGALFFYCLCRDLKRGRPASLLCGAAFGLTGWIGTTEWPQMLTGAIWAPLVFLFFLRAMRGERAVASAGLAGAFLGISLLSGHHQIPLFTGMAVGGAWIYFLARRERPVWREIQLMAIFGVFLALTSALQVLPAWEYGQAAVRWVSAPHPVRWNEPVPYTVHGDFSLFPSTVIGIVIPGIERNANPFLGVVMVSLAFLGVAGAWQERMVRLFAGIALGSLIFSFSAYAIFHGPLYVAIPMLEKARNPSMAVFLFHLGAIVLAAYGLESQAADAWRSRLIRTLTGFGGLLLVLLLVAALFIVKLTFDPDRVALTALTALLLAGLFHGWRREQITPRAAGLGLILLMLLEAGGTTGLFWVHRLRRPSFLQPHTENADIVRFLRNQPGPVRIELDTSEIPYNFGDWHGIDVFGGYLASVTANVYDIHGFYGARMLFGTNFYVGRKPQAEGQVEEYAGRSGLKVFSNPEAFPRAWSVHELVRIRRDEVQPYLAKPLAELRRQAFLLGRTPKLETCAGAEQVRIERHEADRVVMEADLRCRGLVVLGDTYDPGWRATVDGGLVEVFEVYGALRGVVVEGGRHTIEMTYRPRNVYAGGMLTAIGLAGAAWLSRRRRPNPNRRVL